MRGSEGAGYGANVDDAAALPAKLLYSAFGSEKKSEHIRVELARKLLFVYVLQGQVGEDAGILFSPSSVQFKGEINDELPRKQHQ